MARTFEVQTTVLPGNRIEICSPELPEGRIARVVVTVDEPQSALIAYSPSPDFAATEHLYWKDLPGLLQTKPGRWVAYGPHGCVAEGEDWSAVFRQCEQQGLDRDHLLITRVEPLISVVVESTPDWSIADE